LSEGTTSPTNKLDDVKKELRGFTSLHGFSTVLNTSNPFAKILWVFFFLALFSGCVQNVLENMSESVNEYPMTLPAVTFCLATNPFSATNASLNESLLNCSIDETKCDINDFYLFETRTGYGNDILTCYVLNGGKMTTGHLNKIKSTRKTGPRSGFSLQFYLPEKHFFFYYINDANVKPTTSEINKYFVPGTAYDLVIEKTVETKLEYPFNNCWERINMPDTSLVKQFYEANITYRQINCFELCFQNYVQKYALEHKISEDEARRKEEVQNYDREKNCNDLCPLECESTQYKISESKFSEYGEYFLPLIPVVEKKLNITINSTERFKQNFIELFVFFDSLKYTKISQTPKMSLSALVSNLGGSFGLFLDISFISACRVIEFIIGIIFKF